MCVRQVVMQYREHKQEVRLLLPLGDQLISADAGGDVIVWDVQAGGRRVSPTLDTDTRAVAAATPILKRPSCFFAFLHFQTFTCGCSLTPPPSTCRP